MTALEIRSLSKMYGNTPAVSDVSMAVSEGQFLTLLGPSGCGKTTLLRMVAGLVTPDSGAVLISGADVTRTKIHKRRIGMVFQSHALFPHMTVGENVAFGLRMAGVPKAERRQQVLSALETVHLAAKIDSAPNELSGGQQQRVAIARAIVIKPRILLLDEPFGALDRKLRQALQVELRELTRRLKITSIFVTHDQEEALILSDRIAVMKQGQLDQLGSPHEIFEEPGTRFVADFMGFANLRKAEIIESTDDAYVLKSDGLILEAAKPLARDFGPVVNVGLRSEHIVVSYDRPERGDRNLVEGVVANAVYHGDRWSLAVETPAGPMNAIVGVAADMATKLKPGSQVFLSWSSRSVRMMKH